MIVRNDENGKTIEVPDAIGRHLISTPCFSEVKVDEARTPPPPKKARYRRRDMRADK